MDRIVILVDAEFKKSVDHAVMDMYINPLQKGYREIFELGFEQFKKIKVKGEIGKK